jgi:hypothetical protein
MKLIVLSKSRLLKKNLFISTYTEKLFKLAFDFEKMFSQHTEQTLAKISPEGFVFDTDASMFTNYSEITLPHTAIGHNLRNLEDDFSTLQYQIDDIVEKRRVFIECKNKISAANDKARSLMTPEELTLLGL